MYAELTDTFTLTVLRVGKGGNTDDGKYFYSFSPNILMARKAGNINFVLGKDTSSGIRIFAVVDNAGGELGPYEILKEGQAARVFDNMSKPALINVAAVVTDDEADERRYIVCDPQVINVPD